ncbi:MAG TPA: hypothetical protein IAB66_09610 [Candidatus Caccousia avistercoris]|nr:hypothetical protein [Candidatus Caccousia avistercoris]
MKKISKKQWGSLTAALLFAAAAFAVPAYAMELPPASSPSSAGDPVGIYSEPAAPDASQPDTPIVSVPSVEPPVSSDSPWEDPFSSAPPVSDPGFSSGIQPDPEDPLSSSSELPLESGAASEAASSQPPVESEPAQSYQPPVYSQAPIVNPDTDQDAIDALASRAAANSDPEALSSQDWSVLLSSAGSEPSSSGERSEADGETSSASSESGEMESSSQSSWLLPLGIVLILLAVGGIAFFVYAQFVAPNRRPPSGGGTPSGSGSSGGFEDISSSEEYVDISGGAPSLPGQEEGPAEEPQDFAAPAAEPTEEEVRFARQETMEIPLEELPEAEQPQQPERPQMEDIFSSSEAEQAARGEPAAPTAGPGMPEAAAPEPPKAQATPVRPGRDEPFDWEKFFNEK